jgi:multiple sugar transport system ATP-binding protein
LVLLGPSGCGKSTTLRLIAGLEQPDSGTVRIGGVDVTALSPAERKIAMVFQSYALFPHLSVAENIVFGLRVRGVLRAERDSRLRRVSDIVGLSHLLERKPSQLSGGQRQRVALGRAIIAEARVCLMDEPLSNLDAKLRHEMRTEIRALQQRLGMTMVYVTHDQTEAMTLGDRVAVMRAGVIQQVGAPEELYQRPRNLFVAGFIGSPAMNFRPGTLEDGRLRTPLGDVVVPAEMRAKLQRAGAGRDLIVGIRPEHFEDAALVDGRLADGLTFTAVVEVLESLGADKYAYFRVEGARATAKELEELAADAGTGDAPGSDQVVARLDPASRAREGQQLRLWFDPGKLHLFNPGNGAHLTL